MKRVELDAKTDRNSKRFRRALGKLMLIGFGLGVGFVMCEIALRIVGISYPVFERFDQDRGISLTPNTSGWYRNEGEAFIEINRFGYRDVDHELQKKDNTFRIAVLGDSFAEARQVDIESTFWKLIESELQLRATSGQAIEVLNFGIGSYGTTEALLTLEKDAARFSPDIVILAFYCGNDVVNNSKVLSRKIRSEEFRPFYLLRGDELVLDDSFSKIGVKYFRRRAMLAAGQFRTFQLVNNRLKQRKQARLDAKAAAKKSEKESLGNSHDPWYMEPIDPDWQEAWSITEKLITKLKDATEAAGARFVLVTLTMASQVHPDTQQRSKRIAALGIEDLFYNERRLIEHGKENSYTVIPLAPALQQIVDQSGAYLHGFENTKLGSGHWNENGHQQAARIIVDQLLENGLLNSVITNPQVRAGAESE